MEVTIKKGIFVTTVLSILGVMALPTHAYQRPGHNELVSTPMLSQVPPLNPRTSGCEGYLPDIAPSGRYVAFQSVANDLVPGDLNNACDIFRKDRQTGEIVRASVTSTGQEGRVPGVTIPCSDVSSCFFPDSRNPTISNDGRYISFESWAQDLVPGDTNLTWDVFVHDIVKGTTERVSVSSNGEEVPANNGLEPKISANGGSVAFSSAANLAPDPDEAPDEVSSDVFVRDISLGETILASRPPVGWTPSDGFDVRRPAISATGRFVAFDGGGPWVRDLKTEKTLPVLKPDGTTGTEGAFVSDVSSNGRYVAFTSDAQYWTPADGGNIVPGGGPTDAFVHDLRTRRTERVSVNSFGEEQLNEPGIGQVALSPDGRFLAFSSGHPFFAPEEANPNVPQSAPCPLCVGDTDVYVHDRNTGALVWASLDKDGGDKDRCSASAPPSSQKYSELLALSLRARHVVFYSNSSCMVDGDERHYANDVFLRDLGPLLGVGGIDSSSPEEERPDDSICVTPELCVPPGVALSTDDRTNDVDRVLTERGANLYGAALAHRFQYEDLFVRIELEHMPTVVPGSSPIFYGLSFKLNDKSYEVRATSLLGGTFGLFDCSDGLPTCMKVADLRGGYGTTGERVVFSLPLSEIGLENSGELSGVEAFSALGSYFTGATKILDRVAIN